MGARHTSGAGLLPKAVEARGRRGCSRARRGRGPGPSTPVGSPYEAGPTSFEAVPARRVCASALRALADGHGASIPGAGVTASCRSPSLIMRAHVASFAPRSQGLRPVPVMAYPLAHAVTHKEPQLCGHAVPLVRQPPDPGSQLARRSERARFSLLELGYRADRYSPRFPLSRPRHRHRPPVPWLSRRTEQSRG